MRQWDKIDIYIVALGPELSPNHIFERVEWNELGNGEPADRNDQSRSQDFELIIQPRRAIADFVRRGHPIAAAGRFSGKTTNNRGEINCRSDRGLIHAAELFEPAEESSTGGMRERSRQGWLADARRLTDNHDLAQDRAARNWWWNDTRATPALTQQM